MTTNTHLIPFDRDTLTAFEQDGQLYVAIRPICERLGVSWQGQHKKLSDDPQRWGVNIMLTPSSGGMQEMLCLPKGKVFGWLNSIHPGKVAEKARPALRRYQAECDAVLDAWWSGRMGIKADGPIAFQIEQGRIVMEMAEMFRLQSQRMDQLMDMIERTRSDNRALIDYTKGTAMPRLRIEPDAIDLAPFTVRRPERPSQKITPTDRREIEALFKAGFSGADVARAMNMSTALVRKIRRTLEVHAAIAPDPALYQQRKQLIRNIASKPRVRKTLDQHRSHAARRQYGLFTDHLDVH